MRTGQLMTSPAWTVRAETPLKVAAEIMVAQRVSGLPVVDADDRALGVVSEADVLAKERSRPAGKLVGDRKAATAGEAMTAPAITVREEASVEIAAAAMTEYDVERLPVVDRDGRVVGVISRADLVRVAVL